MRVSKKSDCGPTNRFASLQHGFSLCSSEGQGIHTQWRRCRKANRDARIVPDVFQHRFRKTWVRFENGVSRRAPQLMAICSCFFIRKMMINSQIWANFSQNQQSKGKFPHISWENHGKSMVSCRVSLKPIHWHKLLDQSREAGSPVARFVEVMGGFAAKHHHYQPV